MNNNLILQNADIFIQKRRDKLTNVIKKIENLIPNKTVEGEGMLNINDAAEFPIQDIVVKGKTIQDGTPTPDNPVDVEVVTGDVKVNVTGKNLFDGITGNIQVNDTGTIRNGFIFKGVGTFTFSATHSGSSGTYKIKTNDTYSTYTLFTDSFTFTLAENQSLIVYMGNEGASYNNFYSNTQIEIGSTATSYEPYKGQSQLLSLGNIELCKVGAYQDYIYKDKTSGKWYVEKKINKVQITSDKINSYDSRTYDQRILTKQNIVSPAINSTQSVLTACKYFKGITRAASDNPATYNFEVGIAMLNTTGFMITYSLESELNTLELFKNWWEQNNPDIYYVLATPTTTEITDTTLLEQLNTMSVLETYKGINNCIILGNNNVAPDIIITYKQDIEKRISDIESAILALGANV